MSIRVLHAVGDALVEIHGQFANHRLLDQSTHLTALDEFAATHIDGFIQLLSDTRTAYNDYHASELKLRELQDMVARAATEREFAATDDETRRFCRNCPTRKFSGRNKPCPIIATKFFRRVLLSSRAAIFFAVSIWTLRGTDTAADLFFTQSLWTLPKSDSP